MPISWIAFSLGSVLAALMLVTFIHPIARWSGRTIMNETGWREDATYALVCGPVAGSESDHRYISYAWASQKGLRIPLASGSGACWASDIPTHRVSGSPRPTPILRRNLRIPWLLRIRTEEHPPLRDGYGQLQLLSSYHDVGIALWPIPLLLLLIGLPAVIIASRLALYRATLIARYIQGNRTPPGHCPTCGYDLRATPHRCPECGHQPADHSPTPPAKC